MVEPTESATLAELDHFIHAMIAMRGEIANVERGEWPQDNNPLKHAPIPPPACWAPSGSGLTHAKSEPSPWPHSRRSNTGHLSAARTTSRATAIYSARVCRSVQPSRQVVTTWPLR